MVAFLAGQVNLPEGDLRVVSSFDCQQLQLSPHPGPQGLGSRGARVPDSEAGVTGGLDVS